MSNFEFQGLVLDPASMTDAVWAIEHFGYLPNDFHYAVFQHPDLQSVLDMSSESTEAEWAEFKKTMDKLKAAYPSTSPTSEGHSCGYCDSKNCGSLYGDPVCHELPSS